MIRFDRYAAAMRDHKIWGRQVTAGLVEPAVVSMIAGGLCTIIGQTIIVTGHWTAGSGWQNGRFSSQPAVAKCKDLCG